MWAPHAGAGAAAVASVAAVCASPAGPSPRSALPSPRHALPWPPAGPLYARRTQHPSAATSQSPGARGRRDRWRVVEGKGVRARACTCLADGAVPWAADRQAGGAHTCIPRLSHAARPAAHTAFTRSPPSLNVLPLQHSTAQPPDPPTHPPTSKSTSMRDSSSSSMVMRYCTSFSWLAGASSWSGVSGAGAAPAAQPGE